MGLCIKAPSKRESRYGVESADMSFRQNGATLSTALGAGVSLLAGPNRTTAKQTVNTSTPCHEHGGRHLPRGSARIFARSSNRSTRLMPITASTGSYWLGSGWPLMAERTMFLSGDNSTHGRSTRSTRASSTGGVPRTGAPGSFSRMRAPCAGWMILGCLRSITESLWLTAGPTQRGIGRRCATTAMPLLTGN